MYFTSGDSDLLAPHKWKLQIWIKSWFFSFLIFLLTWFSSYFTRNVYLNGSYSSKLELTWFLSFIYVSMIIDALRSRIVYKCLPWYKNWSLIVGFLPMSTSNICNVIIFIWLKMKMYCSQSSPLAPKCLNPSYAPDFWTILNIFRWIFYQEFHFYPLGMWWSHICMMA